MLTTRVIARLDVKPPNVVKGRRFDGLKVMGSLYDVAQTAQAQGADEILYVDIVASLYGRPPNGECIEEVSRDLYIPLTVCGGIRTLEDVRMVMRLGADKVGVNTAAVGRPELLGEIAMKYGSQAVVSVIDAKFRPGIWWEAFTHGGREPSGLGAPLWAREIASVVGEVLLTSVDCDGRHTGGDLGLIARVHEVIPNTPLVYSGGIGTPAGALDALRAGADAIACASLIHTLGLHEVKGYLHSQGVRVRDL